MGSVNKVIILGNLGQDPEVRMTPSGQQVCNISVATTDSWTKDGKREEKTEWHRIVLWGRLAELAGKFLKKGRRVYIEGRLQTRSWDDANGQKKYATDIIGSQLVFVDSAGKGEPDGGSMNDGPQYGAPQGNSSTYGSRNAQAPQGGSDDFGSGDDVPF